MPLTLANLVAISAQILCVVLGAAAVIRALRITAPRLNYLVWRLVLAVCLAVPWWQTPTTMPASLEDIVAADSVRIAPVAARSTAQPEASVEWTVVAAAVIATGILLRLLWLAIGVVRLRRLRVAGVSVPPEHEEALQRKLRTHAEVRYIEAIGQPATFGFRHPVVLLPASLSHRPDARDAVLAHELIHVQRRDWAWLVAEELIRALCWFHPAVWWAITRIQMAREEVVDELAVAMTGNRRAYVRALLGFADRVGVAAAPAFARRRHLFHRIVLLSTEDVMSGRRVVLSAAAVVMGLMIGAWSAMAAFPTQTSDSVLQSQPGPLELSAKLTSPENPIPPAVHLQPASPPSLPDADKAHVSIALRTVIDSAGNVVEVRLASFTFRFDGQPTTMMGGPESIAPLQQPVLQAFVEAAALAVRQSRYDPPAAGPALFTTIVEFTRGEPVAEMRTVPMVQRVSAEGALRVGNAIKPPAKIRDMRPVYPAEAREARVQGVVILEVRIEADGQVGSAGVLRSIPALDQAALDAVYQWRFQPTLLNGAPVPVIMTVTVQFVLQ